jgi:hypothetical protein
MPEVRSPEKPWAVGRHPTYTGYRLTVNVCEDTQGRVWSDHEFTSDYDASTAATTRNQGVEQIAHALMMEALRREVFVEVLMALSHNPNLLQEWDEGDVQRFVRMTTEVVTQKLPKALPGLVRGVLDMMSQQHPGGDGDGRGAR